MESEADIEMDAVEFPSEMALRQFYQDFILNTVPTDEQPSYPHFLYPYRTQSPVPSLPDSRTNSFVKLLPNGEEEEEEEAAAGQGTSKEDNNSTGGQKCQTDDDRFLECGTKKDSSQSVFMAVLVMVHIVISTLTAELLSSWSASPASGNVVLGMFLCSIGLYTIPLVFCIREHDLRVRSEKMLTASQ